VPWIDRRVLATCKPICYGLTGARLRMSEQQAIHKRCE
jgi:hypothetical protein